MTQLTYEQAFDPYHTIFRLLRLKLLLKTEERYRIERIRIIDFYLLFPFLIGDIKLREEDRRFRKMAKAFDDRRPYGRQPSHVTVFARMEPIQRAALTTLANESLLSEPALQNEEVVFLPTDAPGELVARCRARNEEEAPLPEILKVFADEYELLGISGLKGRTGLMEYRNDPV